MKYSFSKQYFPIICSLVTCLLTIQVHADWYGQRQHQPNYNPRFGDFPPKSIDQQLQNQMRYQLDEQEEVSRHENSETNRVIDRHQKEYKDASNQRGKNTTTPYNRNSERYQKPDAGQQTQNYGYYGQENDSRYNGNNAGINNPWNQGGSGIQGPWNNQGARNNRNSGSNPWVRRGSWRGDRDPFRGRGPSEWLSPDKRSLSRNWDDMLNEPASMGKMPGGWTAPSVSVPNPVDVGEEVEDATRDLPDQLNNFNRNGIRR